MTESQHDYYLHLWGEVRKVLVARGLAPKDADKKRHALHVKALGFDKSSKKLTNGEFDKIKGVFLAVARGDDLDAQLAVLEQPAKRAAMVIRRIEVLMLHLKLTPGRESGYVRGIAKKLFGEAGQQYHTLDDVRLAELEGTIVRRLLQLHDRERVEEIQADAAEHAGKIAEIVAPKDGPF